MHFGNYGIFGLLALILDLWAIIHVAQSRAEPFKKAVWIAVIVVMPLFGFLLWLLLGPRSGKD